MALLSKTTINSRQDLDALRGANEYAEFMLALKGSMVRKQNVQTYPDNYNAATYEGPVLNPIWEEVEDLSTITRFGFTKADFQ